MKPDNGFLSAKDMLNFPVHEPKNKLKLHGAPPLIERLWKNALWEIERNYAIQTDYGTVFSAGNGGNYWLAKLFNRDVAFSGILGLNALYPKEMLTSLKAIRRVRLERGWSCPKTHVIRGVPGVIVEDMDNREYILKYGKSTPLNKTDDVVWLWCAFDLLKRHNMKNEEWEWLYETGKECFKKLYAPFYDEKDGLYFGQPTFIDVGSNGYPNELCENKEEACNNCVWIKASSTNSLYYAGLLSMAGAAKKLGLKDEAQEWHQKAEKLAEKMRQLLRFNDGTFSYFRYPDGRLEARREVMGTALPVILDIVQGDDARKAVSGYPFTLWGAPLFYPYFDNDIFYHNNSAWPFASTFLNYAIEKATKKDTSLENLITLVNALDTGTLREVFDMRTQEVAGCNAQLWTIAAFIHTCARLGFTSFLSRLKPFDED